ncbi:GNAT family N-acetyltransferase [Pseudomonas syringae group sp. J309-1]|uniref:GNAT family N-acetyltransferase n=1 Tax=Pseudomonas syringae group sp. J309-1 TaxID=3079588 RepID=UPI0029106487|nr:GNAT family N-acetyltransferase [Pseudomonas syringae group sp. J309-1]MDU8357474.1 GNAT family N-acetyltransferase [Pseudomonas syringae group sp. J309-1]
MPHESNTVQLNPLPEGARDRQNLFALYKQALYEPIDKAFGWHEDFQRHRFNTHYSDQTFVSIEVESVVRGYAVLNYNTGEMHLSLLLLHPDHQNQGIGQRVMKNLMSRAIEANHVLTLSCFLSNQRAMSFYQKLGFDTVATDEHFVTYRYLAD